MAAFASNSITNVYSLNTVNFLANAQEVGSTVTNIFNSSSTQVIFTVQDMQIWYQETPEPINQRTIWG